MAGGQQFGRGLSPPTAAIIAGLSLPPSSIARRPSPPPPPPSPRARPDKLTHTHLHNHGPDVAVDIAADFPLGCRWKNWVFSVLSAFRRRDEIEIRYKLFMSRIWSESRTCQFDKVASRVIFYHFRSRVEYLKKQNPIVPLKSMKTVIPFKFIHKIKVPYYPTKNKIKRFTCLTKISRTMSTSVMKFAQLYLSHIFRSMQLFLAHMFVWIMSYGGYKYPLPKQSVMIYCLNHIIIGSRMKSGEAQAYNTVKI